MLAIKFSIRLVKVGRVVTALLPNVAKSVSLIAGNCTVWSAEIRDKRLKPSVLSTL